MHWRDAVLCSVFAVALPLGQVMFKYASIYNTRLDGPFLLRVLQNWPLLGAFAWYGVTALFWFYVLTRVPLSSAYVFSLVGSALVPIAAWALFKEPFNPAMLVGYGLILAGFFVVVSQTTP
ncbi:DMT family transporter [Phenylobacterium koreense]|uniref:Multidrug transporter EmrE-like cation transporter n=1 Tax=Phenylobacterium koreense TaxID=266125 RepID=A0ABV2EQA5_9CAUL